MAKQKGGLGRGLGALLPEYNEILDLSDSKEGIVELELKQIDPNPDQPRKSFDEDKLTDLAESIREHGVLQPILVAPRKDRYMIIAGERRFRASQRAGLKTIPALVRDLDTEKIMELALIENVQRDDLSPMEEARAYHALLSQFGYTQEKLAKQMGKSRSAIANMTRLLALPEAVQQMVEDGRLTVGHARALLSIENAQLQTELAYEIYQSGLNVRQVEKLVQDMASQSQDDAALVQKRAEYRRLPAELRILQEQLAERLSTKVAIKKKGDGGKLVIEYYSDEDLKRIIDGLQGNFY